MVAMLHHQEHNHHHQHHIPPHLTGAKKEPKTLEITQAQAIYGTIALLAVFFILVKPLLAVLALLLWIYVQYLHPNTRRKRSSSFWKKSEHDNNSSSRLGATALSLSPLSENVLDDVAASISIPRLKSEKVKRVHFLP
jgi:hypothetical protein